MDISGRNGSGIDDLFNQSSMTEEEPAANLVESGDDPESSVPGILEEKDFLEHDVMPRPVHWSVGWSDLMMTMFIFFLVLYVYKDANKIFLSSEGLGGDYGKIVGSLVPFEGGGGAPEGAAMEESMARIYDFSRQFLEKGRLYSLAEVNLLADDAVRIILSSDLLFDSGEADLKDDARIALRIIADLLRQTPYVINVIGHTDDVPVRSQRYASNWELSVVRASAVARFMIGELGLPPEQFYITGHSSYRPLKPNDSPQNRAANRRVEIVISRRMPYAS